MSTCVDIALAVYNGEAYLGKFLGSLSRQTHQNWRLHASDDGSSDATLRILNAFASAHPDRLVVLPGKARIGVKANFSRALQACTAEYILPADQDDIWEPDKIERLLMKIQDLEMRHTAQMPLLVHCDLRLIDENDAVISRSFWHHQHLCPEYGTSLKNTMVQNTVTGCACILNRSLLEKALPIPESCIMHDWWLALTATALGRLSYLKRPLVRYRQHANNAVGAQKWGLALLRETVLGGGAPLRERLARTQRQAACFLQTFHGDLTRGQQEALRSFATIATHNYLKRRLTALRHRLRKCDLTRTIGFYLSL
jgi:glycosyltransferase involved in cell wall biosynthesis